SGRGRAERDDPRALPGNDAAGRRADAGRTPDGADDEPGGRTPVANAQPDPGRVTGERPTRRQPADPTAARLDYGGTAGPTSWTTAASASTSPWSAFSDSMRANRIPAASACSRAPISTS